MPIVYRSPDEKYRTTEGSCAESSPPPSLDTFETTAHRAKSESTDPIPDPAPDPVPEPDPDPRMYRHAYRTFGCKNCTTVHPYVAYARCGDRTCPDCRRVDYYRLLDAYRPAIAEIGKHGLKLVTLTLTNRTELDGAVDDLREAWKKLRRRDPYREAWKGGLYAIECVNKGRGWHVHLHVLVEGTYVAQAHLAADWRELTGDSFVVDIREVKHPVIGLKYILKYLKKAPTVSGHEGEYNEVLKGKRLVQAFGSWYGEVRAKDDDKPLLVCETCGSSSWMVILQPATMPLEEYRSARDVLAFFDALARAG